MLNTLSRCHKDQMPSILTLLPYSWKVVEKVTVISLTPVIPALFPPHNPPCIQLTTNS